MNIYIVTEGEVGEVLVYQHWVPLVNPQLTYVNHISLISKNNFSIIAGGGYPNYFEVVEHAVEDVCNHSNIDRLVVAVDSEDISFADKYDEISQFILGLHCTADIKIVVQHFCLETWALGNNKIIRDNPQCEVLRRYKKIFNVKNLDPELLPANKNENLNRSQFAEKYLRRALNDKYRRLTYTKANPQVLLHDKYFIRVKERYLNHNHIKSFNDFLRAFV